jgi:TPR repeat protein
VDPAKAKAAKTEQDRKVLEYQKQRAESGAPSAQYDLGMRYLDGDGVEKDPELGRKWLEAAAKNGNSQAAKKLEQFKPTLAPPKL